jgi:glycosyltransferase involved in cell wall biosynthesis
MLEPWATRRRPLKKRFMSFLNENACLGEAACIRALTTLEANAIRARGLLNPVCVLPNGMDVPEAGREAHPAWRDKVPIGKNILLYLGRIHPKKGLPDLLRAWHLLREEGPVTARNWHLVIAGWNQDGHEDELRQLVSLMGLCASVHFVGPQFGRDKSATYQAATAFVLPSLSEGLPMTVLEAWAHRLPVLMTPECNLLEAFEAKAALGAEPNISGLAQGLETLFGLDALDRKRMADRAYDLMKERFSWNIIGAQMHDVCRWLLGEIEQPACVSARAAALASA